MKVGAQELWNSDTLNTLGTRASNWRFFCSGAQAWRHSQKEKMKVNKRRKDPLMEKLFNVRLGYQIPKPPDGLLDVLEFANEDCFPNIRKFYASDAFHRSVLVRQKDQPQAYDDSRLHTEARCRVKEKVT